MVSCRTFPDPARSPLHSTPEYKKGAETGPPPSAERFTSYITSVSGATPKLTLNRRHQIETDRYFVRSSPSGTS